MACLVEKLRQRWLQLTVLEPIRRFEALGTAQGVPASFLPGSGGLLELLYQENGGGAASIPSIFSILESEPAQGSDDSFLRACHKHFESVHARYVKPKGLYSTCFGITHFSTVVEYSTKGWLQQNAALARARILEVLSSSRHFFVLQMLQDLRLAFSEPVGPSHVTSLVEAAHELCSFPPDTTVRFVQCIRSNQQSAPDRFDSKLVLEQLQTSSVVAACSLAAMGPQSFTLHEFIEQFAILAPGHVTRVEESQRPQLARTILVSSGVGSEDFTVSDYDVILNAAANQRILQARNSKSVVAVIRAQCFARKHIARRRVMKRRELLALCLAASLKAKLDIANAHVDASLLAIAQQPHAAHGALMVLTHHQLSSALRSLHHGLKDAERVGMNIRTIRIIRQQWAAVMIQNMLRRRRAVKKLKMRRTLKEDLLSSVASGSILAVAKSMSKSRQEMLPHAIVKGATVTAIKTITAAAGHDLENNIQKAILDENLTALGEALEAATEVGVASSIVQLGEEIYQRRLRFRDGAPVSSEAHFPLSRSATFREGQQQVRTSCSVLYSSLLPCTSTTFEKRQRQR